MNRHLKRPEGTMVETEKILVRRKDNKRTGFRKTRC